MPDYLNLTNGIEACPVVSDVSDVRFIRIQSSWCEQHHWDRTLQQVSDDLLLHLALGHHCRIFDFTNGYNQPRALRQGAELLRYVATRLWLGDEPIPMSAQVRYFREVFNQLDDRRTIRKYTYFSRFVPTGLTALRLELVSGQTIHDGNYPWYVEYLHNRMGVGQ